MLTVSRSSQQEDESRAKVVWKKSVCVFGSEIVVVVVGAAITELPTTHHGIMTIVAAAFLMLVSATRKVLPSQFAYLCLKNHAAV